MSNEDRYIGLPAVNRCVVVLIPTVAYFEWTSTCPESDSRTTLESLQEDVSAYLIPEVDAGPDAWLKRNYKAMFEQELENWYTDEAFWPADRSYKVFRKFFDVRFCSLVFDMGEGAIVRDIL